MARQVLPWVGMAVGAYFGNPQLGFMIGSMVGNAVDPQVIKGPALGEGQNNSASEGGYRPIVLGKGAVGVCMIHEGPIKKRTIRTQQSKGGGPVTEEERAYRTMAFALGESAYPDTGVVLLRLWIDNKLRYDITATSQIAAESAEFADEFTFYPGTEAQLPDPDLESFLGAGNVPSYRGGSPYIVFPDWDVTDSGGRAPMIKAELASDGTGGIGTEWIMAAQYLNSAELKISPDGLDWSAPAFRVSTGGDNFWNPGSTKISTHGTEVICYSGINPKIIYSADSGGTWSNFGFPGGLSGYRCARAGGVWWIHKGTGFNVITFDGVTTTDMGFQADSLCALNNKIYSTVNGGYGRTIVDRGLDGANHGSFLIDAGWVSGQQLYGGSGEVLVCYESEGVDPGRMAVFNGIEVLPLEFPFENEETPRWDACWSQGLGLWIVVYGQQVAYGPTLQTLSISDYTLPNTIGQIAENGDKFILCGAGRMLVSTVDGVAFETIPSPTNTNSGTILQAISPLELAATGTAEPVPLSTIASFIHDRVDIPTSKIDVAQLTDLVEGVVFADGYTGADAMRSAMAWYQFDAVEADIGGGYRINYIKRGGSAELTLTEADIVDGPEDWEREDSYERPRVLHIAYQNPIADYGAPVIPIKRTSHDVKVVGERSVSIPFVTSDQNEVARRGDVALTVIYTEIAGTVEVILPISMLPLVPTNAIGYSIRGRVRRLRMTDWKFSPDGTIKTEWIADRQSAYTSQLTALPAVPTTPPPPSIAGPTISAVLDIPALVDSLDNLHLYAAATGMTEGWWGSVHQRRLPWDTDYTTAAQFTRPATIIGTLVDAVADASEHFTDTTNVVRVTLYQDDELETFTQQQFLSENGAFALSWEDSGRRLWEVCQYRDAVKVGDRTWEVSTLLRGRLNTETAEHPFGSLFVVLDSSVRVMPMQSAWIGEDITHRAVSNGQLPDQAVPYTEEYTGESQREWPVASVAASFVGDDLTISYVPRHRFGTDDHPVRSVNWDGYRVTATDGASTETVDTLSEFHTFDVTGWATPITVSVSQLNRFTGEGPAVIEEVP